MSEFSSEWIKVSEAAPHVLLVELARKPVNAFSTEFWTAYGQTFDRISGSGKDIRAVVLASVFPKIFTAGLDLADAASVSGSTADPGRTAFQIQNIVRAFQSAIGAPERCPFPVIAAVHGLVIGLGMDMISACDIRYAASNAAFSIKEVDIGLAADIGTLAYLPKATGNMSLVREMAYTAQFFTPDDALRMGMLSKVVEGGQDAVVKAAIELAKVIATKSPVAVFGTKQILTHSRDNSVSDNLEYTAIWNSAAVQSKDMAETLAAMKQKRAPSFLARTKL